MNTQDESISSNPIIKELIWICESDQCKNSDNISVKEVKPTYAKCDMANNCKQAMQPISVTTEVQYNVCYS